MSTLAKNAPAKALTRQERSELERFEGVVDRGLSTFIEVGEALYAIRESRLYRETHSSFDAYCRERWGLRVQRVDSEIRYAVTAREVSQATGLPVANAGQARALDEVRVKAGTQAAAQALTIAADRGKVTGDAILDAAQSLGVDTTGRGSPKRQRAKAAQASPVILARTYIAERKAIGTLLDRDEALWLVTELNYLLPEGMALELVFDE